MTSDTRKKKLIRKLKNKEYRDAFVLEHINNAIPFQLQALRKKEKLTQRELGEKSGKTQAWISKIENPNYSKFSLATLQEFASVFDVGLVVKFAPFSELINWEINLSPEDIQVKSFDEEKFNESKKVMLENGDTQTEENLVRILSNAQDGHAGKELERPYYPIFGGSNPHKEGPKAVAA